MYSKRYSQYEIISIVDHQMNNNNNFQSTINKFSLYKTYSFFLFYVITFLLFIGKLFIFALGFVCVCVSFFFFKFDFASILCCIISNIELDISFAVVQNHVGLVMYFFVEYFFISQCSYRNSHVLSNDHRNVWMANVCICLHTLFYFVLYLNTHTHTLFPWNPWPNLGAFCFVLKMWLCLFVSLTYTTQVNYIVGEDENMELIELLVQHKSFVQSI